MRFSQGKKKVIAAVIGTTVAAACLGVAAPANAESESGPQKVTLYSPLTGDSKTIELNKPASVRNPGGISTQSIGPYGNTYCDTAASSFKLKDYHNITGTHYPSGNTAFTCGNANGGFIHVRNKHAKDWIVKYAKYGEVGGLDWSDIADFDIKTTLGAPLSTADAGSQKTCFGGLVQIRSYPSNKVLFKYEPTIFVSQNNRRIITAYPSTYEQCSGLFG